MPTPTLSMPPELELAAHYFCDLSGKDAKEFTNSKKNVQNWQHAAAIIRDHINVQRALMMASRQIAEEDQAAHAAAQSANGSHGNDLDDLPDPMVIIP